MAFGRKATQQDITWFLDLYNNGQRLDLNPAYQRKSVWGPQDKDFFIDSVVNNYPCPAVFLFKETDSDGNTIYHVVDGKQRLQTIISFSKNEFSLSATNENVSPLFRGKSFNDLSPEHREAFWDYTIPVELITTKEESDIKTIFDRLNRNNKTLTSQELRKAKYDGLLYSFVANQSIDEFWKENVRITKRDFDRMLDQQFIAELVLLTLTANLQQFNQSKLDELYANFDVEFQEEAHIEDSFLKTKALITTINNHNSAVRSFFYTRSGFYTIWAFLLTVINDSSVNVVELADKLKSFGEEVKASGEDSSDVNVSKYCKHNKQATTDIQQRQNRHDSLVSYLGL